MFPVEIMSNKIKFCLLFLFFFFLLGYFCRYRNDHPLYVCLCVCVAEARMPTDCGRNILFVFIIIPYLYLIWICCRCLRATFV